MSKGMGKVQRDILDVLAKYGPIIGKPPGYLHTHLVCFAVWMPAEGRGKRPTEAQARSYRRALAKLVKLRLIVRARKKDKIRNDLLKITDLGMAAAGYMHDRPVPTEAEYNRLMGDFTSAQELARFMQGVSLSPAARAKRLQELMDKIDAASS